MKLVLIAICLLLVVVSALRRDSNKEGKYPPSPLKNGTFETPFDHFSPLNTRLLKLRYVANLEFHRRHGGHAPIFLFINFHSEFDSPSLLRRGLVYELARKHDAAIVQSDFRYMGYNALQYESNWVNCENNNEKGFYFRNIFRNATEQNDLQHMSIDHILADIPHLIEKLQKDFNTQSRVVTFGAHIGGAIAVLARKKYPHLIDGAWSSRGVYDATADTFYYTDLGIQFEEFGFSSCHFAMKRAFHQIKEIVDTKDNDQLQRLFKINPLFPVNLENPQYVRNFYVELFSDIPKYLYVEK